MSALRGGLLNRAINALPFKLYILGYQFFSLGIRLTKRLARRRGYKFAECGVLRIRHCVFSEQRYTLIDKHSTDKILVDKALGRIVTRYSWWRVREKHCCCRRGSDERLWAWTWRRRRNEKKEKTDTPTTKRGGAFPFLQCWARWNSWSAERPTWRNR